MSRAPRLLFVVNNAAFFVSHRLPIALAARDAGYEVAVATPDGPAVAKITAEGFRCHIIPMDRAAVTPMADLAALVSLLRLFRRLKPDIVHAVTLKAVVFGGIAARVARVPSFVAAISGLGYAFVDRGEANYPLRRIVERLCRTALRHRNVRVILQNDADREAVLAFSGVQPSAIRMIRGSGVDLSEFRPAPEATGVPLVVMTCRMLRDKGVAEFAQAARMLTESGHEARFALVGDVDRGNPASCTADELHAYETTSNVEWWGFRSEVAVVLAAACIVALPSYYREGVPKSLLEAAAAGRPVVTTDLPGCRDAVTRELTGLIVPPRDAKALAAAIAKLLESPERRRKMGKAGRAKAEREFGIDQVVAAHTRMYDELVTRTISVAASGLRA